jgi:class 3 adenylate cyclase
VHLWNPRGPEVEAADASPWDGPLASVMRPFPTTTLVRVVMTAAILWFVAGVSAAVFAFIGVPGVKYQPLGYAIVIIALAVGVGITVMIAIVTPRQLRVFTPTLAILTLFAGPLGVTLALICVGPRYGVATVVYIESPLFAFYLLRRTWALLCAAEVMFGFAIALMARDGWVAPVAQWIGVLSTVLATAILMGMLAEQGDRLAESEHRARVELADLNATLEARVATQVDEIERLGRLRRFLSPQIAEAVLTTGTQALTEPHRRRIAVFFCDLRGFTAFANNAEPEDVVGVLDEYYRAVGDALQRDDATVGGYAGDGIMAYFGDPVPRPDAAVAAVHVATEVRSSLDRLIVRWRNRGYALSYGIGIAFGYATLGVVGFDGRYDYTALGPVVNLAARLCEHAAGGEILLDQATHAATSDTLPSSPRRELDVKGYAAPIPAFVL